MRFLLAIVSYYKILCEPNMTPMKEWYLVRTPQRVGMVEADGQRQGVWFRRFAY